MSIGLADITDAVTAHAASGGWFDTVTGYEPKNAPGKGLSAAVWVDALRPLATRSGLAATAALLVLNVRAYASMTAEPQGSIDPNLLAAVDDLISAYSGDFTLDDLVAEVDLLGNYHPNGLNVKAGYLDISGQIHRALTIEVPLVLNDVWVQAP